MEGNNAILGAEDPVALRCTVRRRTGSPGVESTLSFKVDGRWSSSISNKNTVSESPGTEN